MEEPEQTNWSMHTNAKRYRVADESSASDYQPMDFTSAQTCRGKKVVVSYFHQARNNLKKIGKQIGVYVVSFETF